MYHKTFKHTPKDKTFKIFLLKRLDKVFFYGIIYMLLKKEKKCLYLSLKNYFFHRCSNLPLLYHFFLSKKKKKKDNTPPLYHNYTIKIKRKKDLTFSFFYDIITVDRVKNRKHEQMFVRTNDRANKRSPAAAQRTRAYRVGAGAGQLCRACRKS